MLKPLHFSLFFSNSTSFDSFSLPDLLTYYFWNVSGILVEVVTLNLTYGSVQYFLIEYGIIQVKTQTYTRVAV